MRASKRHQELTDGVGCCSVPMWQMGMECFCEKPAYGEQEKGQRRYGEYAWDGRWIPGYCGGLACYNHGGPQKPEPAPESAPPFLNLPDQQQDLAPEIQQLISKNMDALVDQPAPATDVEALLAEAEDYAKTSVMRGMGSASTSANWICRLATALRESRAREVAEESARVEAEREFGEMRNNILKAADDIDLWRSRAKRETDLRLKYEEETNRVRAERDAAIARAEKAEAQLALCAENTAAADLAQEVECLKAEIEALRGELARVRKDAAADIRAAYREGCADGVFNENDRTNRPGRFWCDSEARRAALALGGEAEG